MAVIALKEWKVTLQDAEPIYLYATEDLSCLDLVLRRTVKIESTGRMGLENDGAVTHDGKVTKTR